MTCSRGKAAPDAQTRLRLFADSGGFCQSPSCLRELFVDVSGAKVNIAEMAHILAASDTGPRSRRSLPAAERGAYDNLILLCSSCHTIVDKSPETHTDKAIREWKKKHKERIASAFGAVKYTRRGLLRNAIDPLLTENKTIFDSYGPHLDYRFDPESEHAGVWQRKVLSRILPNNRKILAMLDANRNLLTRLEQDTLEEFRQHLDDLQNRHIGSPAVGGGLRYPDGMRTLLVDGNG